MDDGQTGDAMVKLKRAAPIQFRDKEIEAELDTRAGKGLSLSLVARRDLQRYYALMRRSLPAFSEPEASLIVDAMRGARTEPHTVEVLWAGVDDAVRGESLDEKWDVDGAALVDRLRSLTPFGALTVADACERFWRRTDLSTGENLRRVGLVK